MKIKMAKTLLNDYYKEDLYNVCTKHIHMFVFSTANIYQIVCIIVD